MLVPDLDGTLELTTDQVQRLADRRAGLGGDGVIRVVRDRTRPRRPRCARRRATPSGSWTTATPTARSPRCAATGRASSPRTSARGPRRRQDAFTHRHPRRRQDGAGSPTRGMPSTSVRGASSTRRVPDATASTSWSRPRHGKTGAGAVARPRQPAHRRHAPRGHRPRDLDLSEAPAAAPGAGRRDQRRVRPGRSVPGTSRCGSTSAGSARPARAAPALRRPPSRPASGPASRT